MLCKRRHIAFTFATALLETPVQTTIQLRRHAWPTTGTGDLLLVYFKGASCPMYLGVQSYRGNGTLLMAVKCRFGGIVS